MLKTVNETIGSIKETILLNVGKKNNLMSFSNNIAQSEKLTLINYIVKSLPRYF